MIEPLLALSLAATTPLSTFQLDNGLTVLVAPDRSLPKAYVEVRYRVGSANEAEGRSGFAHLFEHLMFEGSRNVPEGAFDEWLESAGGDNNAWTSNDRTVYHETVPSSALELALFLEADRMASLLDGMPDSVVDAQREVVRNERRQRYEVRPYGQVDLVVQGALHPPGHPYHRPVIGSHEDLAAATTDDVKAFFREFYVPSNATLMVAGDVDIDDVKAMVHRHFGRVAPGKAPPAPTAAPIVHTAQTSLMLEDDVDLPKLVIAWPSVAWLAPGDAELDLLQEVLVEGRTGRLRQRLVDELGLAQSVSAWQVSRDLSGYFEIEVLAREGVELDKVLALVDEELARVAREGPTDDELLQARRAVQLESLDSAERLSQRAAKLHAWFQATGGLDGIAADLARYAGITTADVQVVAAKTFGPGRVVVSVVPRGKASLAVAGSRLVPAEPDVPMSEVEPGKAKRPAPELSRPLPGPPPALTLPAVRRWKMAGGVDVASMQREGTGLFDLRVVLAGGADDDPIGKEGLAHLAAAMAGRGAGDRDAIALEAALRRLGASVDVWAGWDTTSIHLHVPADAAVEATALIADVLFRPRMAAEEWMLLSSEEATAIVRGRSSPRALLGLAQQRAVYGDAHRRGSRLRGTSTSLKAIGLDDVRARWADRVGRGRPLVIVGSDLDDEQLRACLAPLDAWSPDPRPVASRAQTLPSPRRSVAWVDRPGSVQTGLAVAGPVVETVPLQDAASISMATLLGGSFASRLNNNLREVHQYAYGANAYVVRNPWMSYLGVRTQVATDVTGAALEQIVLELDRIQVPAIESELERVRAYTLLSLPDEVETGRDAVGELAWLHSEGGDFNDTARLAEQVPSVTAEQVAGAARAVLVGEGFHVIGVGSLAQARDQLGDAYGPIEVFTPDVLLGPAD